jgi:hypothetical protein
MSVSVEDMPRVVFEPYGFLLDETGVEPVVFRPGPGRMDLVHSSDRVRMVIRFRLSGHTWQWVKSTLHVDGEKKPIAASWPQYAAIFKDPDEGRRNYVPKGARKAVLPEMRLVDERYAPAVVVQCVHEVRALVGSHKVIDVTVSLTQDQSQYAIAAQDEEGGRIVYWFRDDRCGAWEPHAVTLISPTGYDITQFHSDRIDDALLEFLGSTSRAAQRTTLPGGHAVQASVTNSVEVRKATVRRV